MSSLLTRRLAAAGAALALTTTMAGLAWAAPLQIRFIDVDSASYNSFVGVYGAGFGDVEGQIQFGGATSIEIAHWSDGLIIARIPAGAQTGPVKVITDGDDEVDSPVALKIHTGAIYVVASFGSDAAVGDEANPFQTLHRALSVVTPGDTVLVRTGTYDEQEITPTPLPALYFQPGNGGTEDRPITWRGYADEVPVIRATQPSVMNSPVVFVGADYLRLARLEINGTNNTSTGVSVWASNTWVVGLDVHSFGEAGISVGEASAAVIAGNRIWEGGTRPGLDHGIHVIGTGATIRNNEIFDLLNGYGVFLEYQTQSNANVFGNYIHDVAGGGIGLSRVKGGNRVYNNVVWNAGLSQGCRCALEVAYGAASGESATTDRVYYNTFVGPGFTGMFVADRSGTIESHGNIFSDFRVGMRVDDDVSKTSLSSSHNIWHAQGDPPEFKWGGPWIDYIEFKTQSQQENSSILADPVLVSPATGDMHLTSVSPGIDSGGGPDQPSIDFDGVDRPNGTGPDIGAYEYTGQGGGGGGGTGGSGGGTGGGAGEAGSSGGGSGGDGGGTGGSGGSGGGNSDAGTDGGTTGGGSDDGGGCGCAVPGSRSRAPVGFVLGLAALALLRRR